MEEEYYPLRLHYGCNGQLYFSTKDGDFVIRNPKNKKSKAVKIRDAKPL